MFEDIFKGLDDFEVEVSNNIIVGDEWDTGIKEDVWRSPTDGVWKGDIWYT